MWLYLGKDISKDWSVDNMKKTRLNGYVYNFSVDYDAIAADDISNIYMYLMKKKKKTYKNVWVYYKSIFYRINNFINFIERKSIKMYFNEQSITQSKTWNC